MDIKISIGREDGKPKYFLKIDNVVRSVHDTASSAIAEWGRIESSSKIKEALRSTPFRQ
jgi:hypothetical protein